MNVHTKLPSQIYSDTYGIRLHCGKAVTKSLANHVKVNLLIKNNSYASTFI